MQEQATSYRRSFRDIARGYSTAKLEGQEVYVKHLSPHDQVEIEEIQEGYHQSALERGVQTREQMLKILRDEGDWTREDERQIEEEERFLASLVSAKSKIVLPSHVSRQNELIKESQAKLNFKLKQKEDLLSTTCESYAQGRTNDYYIIKSYYKTADLTEPLFNEAQFDRLDASVLNAIIEIYNKIFKNLSEDYIQHMTLEPFFSPYLGFTDDSMQFFGKPFVDLSHCQIKLIVYSKLFKNIFENTPDIPEKILQDPKALMEFASTATDERDKIKEKFKESSGSTIVGATQEDYQELGLGTPAGSVDLHEEARKKGGTLSMQDLMKLSGVD